MSLQILWDFSDISFDESYINLSSPKIKLAIEDNGFGFMFSRSSSLFGGLLSLESDEEVKSDFDVIVDCGFLFVGYRR